MSMPTQNSTDCAAISSTAAIHVGGPASEVASDSFVDDQWAEKRELFGMQIDAVDMNDSLLLLKTWIQGAQRTEAGGCRYVVTPNVDHVVMFQENDGLRAAYADAHLVVADGHPVVLASKLLKRPLPERVAGSELVPKLFDVFNATGKLKVFLLGAAEGVAEVASLNMGQQWPNVKTVGFYSPPMGFENDVNECADILQRISACKPDVVIVGFGAPKQELWVHQYHRLIDAEVALCVGATIDFLAGEKKRAPLWMQKSGLEWVHRMCSEPKRLVKRYSKDAWVFPQLVAKQWVADARKVVADQHEQKPSSDE